MTIIQAIKSINWKNVLTRALWTALQTFLAVFLVAGESLVNFIFSGDWQALWTLSLATLLSAITACLSALKTITIELLNEIKAKTNGTTTN